MFVRKEAEMKRYSVFLTFLLLFIPIGVGSAAGSSPKQVVVLTADQVHTAGDIEYAFHQATGWGNHPGVVVLDGIEGIFQYDPEYGDDYDINIFYSHLTLKGVNSAAIQGGGINFDGMDLEDITIENLSMHCPADCITSWGLHKDITIQGNQLIASGIGIQAAETSGWRIRRNTIQAGWVAVHLLDTARIGVQNNRLAGFIPVMLQGAHFNLVASNTLLGTWEGVLLSSSTNSNLVTANTILNVQSAGISLEPDTQGNQVHGNSVQCMAGYDCMTVQAGELEWVKNNLAGNRP
jgi:parallel beta-helix repeat protein